MEAGAATVARASGVPMAAMGGGAHEAPHTAPAPSHNKGRDASGALAVMGESTGRGGTNHKQLLNVIDGILEMVSDGKTTKSIK
eukprot:622572-Prorocentrum_minimum.AAC.1